MHTYIHTYIPPREDQCEWHRMTRMTGPDCVVMCNLINTYIHTTYIHTYIHMCNLINTYIHTYIHTFPPWEDQYEWHRMTRMTGPDCAVMCNLLNIHTYIHTYIHTCIHTYIHTYIINTYIHTYMHRYIQYRGAQGTLSLSKNCTSRESVSPLSRLIRGFRNK